MLPYSYDDLKKIALRKVILPYEGISENMSDQKIDEYLEEYHKHLVGRLREIKGLTISVLDDYDGDGYSTYFSVFCYISLRSNQKYSDESNGILFTKAIYAPVISLTKSPYETNNGKLIACGRSSFDELSRAPDINSELFKLVFGFSKKENLIVATKDELTKPFDSEVYSSHPAMDERETKVYDVFFQWDD